MIQCNKNKCQLKKNNNKYPYYFNSQNLALILFDGVMSKHGIYPAGNAHFVVNECVQNV